MIFDLSAKDVHVELQSVYWNIFFVAATNRIELKYTVEHPLDETIQKWQSGEGHMTKVAATPIIGQHF